MKGNYSMSKAKRISANLPEKLLLEATNLTNAGITETIILGLQLIKRSSAFLKAQKLKGNLNLKIDLGISRERSCR